jgi:hypothetical protein
MENENSSSEAGSDAGLNMADHTDRFLAAEQHRSALRQSSCPAEHRVLPWLVEHARQQERAAERAARLITLEARAHEAHAATCTARSIALLLEVPADEQQGDATDERTQVRIDGRWYSARAVRAPQPRPISQQRLRELTRTYDQLELEASESEQAARAVRDKYADPSCRLTVDWSARLRCIEQELETLPALSPHSHAHAALVDRCQREARVIRSLLAEQARP